MLLGKTDSIEVLISKALIDAYISHDEFVSVNNEMKEERKKSWNLDVSRNTCDRNSIETTVDNDGILWLNKRHTEEGLDHKNLQEI